MGDFDDLSLVLRFGGPRAVDQDQVRWRIDEVADHHPDTIELWPSNPGLELEGFHSCICWKVWDIGRHRGSHFLTVLVIG